MAGHDGGGRLPRLARPAPTGDRRDAAGRRHGRAGASTRTGCASGSRTGSARLPGVTVWSRAERRTPTLLLTFDGRDAADAYRFLGRARRQRPGRLLLRAGGLAPPRPGDTGGLRIGLAPYNDDDDVDRLLAGLREWAAA